MASPATFAAVAVTIYAAHQAGDFWVQTGEQAAKKGLPGAAGRIHCVMHVVTYMGALTAFLAVTTWWLGLRLQQPWYGTGLALTAVTHYFADRRSPLERLCRRLGKGGFYKAGSGLATGAFLLDQAWHWAWLFASALVISGPPQ